MKEKKQINVEIGRNIKQLRESAGLTQEAFSELVGLGEKHISAIERGAVGLSLPTLQRICTLLSVSADRVLFGQPEEGPANDRTAAVQLVTERLSRLPDRQFWAVKRVLDTVLAAMEPGGGDNHVIPR